jgi:hypothetical protein
MMVSEARVPASAQIHWSILKMAMQMESEILRPQLTSLTTAFEQLHCELEDIVKQLETLVSELDPVLHDALQLKSDTWEDNYTLCGNPRCDGDCRVCQEGEEDYEIDDTEKYCRRRR